MNTSDLTLAQDALRQEFNRWAEAGRGEAMEEEHAAIAAGMLAEMRFDERDKILDLGCGAGWFSAILASKVPTGQVVGLDVADDMIRRARRNYMDPANLMFVVAPVEGIPWDNDFFNKVVSIESSYYWPDPARALREIFRVLRPGGTMRTLINLYKDNPYAHQWQEKLETPTHLLSGEEWCELFRQAGFEETRQSKVPDPRPVPENYQSRWFRNTEELRQFRELGALLVVGRKPAL